MCCDDGLSTLAPFRYKRRFVAEDGGRGLGKLKHGKNGKDVDVMVPVGTEVLVGKRQMKRVADLTVAGERTIVARGGRGGRGNARLVSPTNRFPLLAEEGDPGEERELRLDLKLLADVGIIGAPNAGKSTLLASISAARPKIAEYPFTTTEPVLGVVEHRDKSFVAVDIPGLIEGAHQGVGMGQDFLRHVERTRVLVHMLDGAGTDVVGDYRRVRDELRYFSGDLMEKGQIIAINKMDLPGVEERFAGLRASLEPREGPVYCIAAATRQGLDELLSMVVQLLDDAQAERDPPPARGLVRTLPILRPRGLGKKDMVRKEDGAYVVSLRAATRFAATVDVRNWNAMIQLLEQLRRLGVITALEKRGIQQGDLVRVGSLEWEWE